VDFIKQIQYNRGEEDHHIRMLSKSELHYIGQDTYVTMGKDIS
jgi:hypothetical protein